METEKLRILLQRYQAMSNRLQENCFGPNSEYWMGKLRRMLDDLPPKNSLPTVPPDVMEIDRQAPVDFGRAFGREHETWASVVHDDNRCLNLLSIDISKIALVDCLGFGEMQHDGAERIARLKDATDQCIRLDFPIARSLIEQKRVPAAWDRIFEQGGAIHFDGMVVGRAGSEGVFSTHLRRDKNGKISLRYLHTSYPRGKFDPSAVLMID